MRRAVKYKNLIAFAVVLIVLISITAVPAYAEFPPLTTAGRRLGAFLLSAIQAINITLSSTAAQSPGADIMNYIADPLDVQYSYSEMWEDQPKIQIWKDYINIDGIEYTDIWLSNEAATKFQVDAYDFRSAYNIASNSNGTFASGLGDVDNVPIYSVDGMRRSQDIMIPYESGNFAIGDSAYVHNSIYSGSQQANSSYQYNGAERAIIGQRYNYKINYPIALEYYVNGSGNVQLRYKYDNAQAYNFVTPSQAPLFNSAPFDFDWVASSIPAQRVLEPDEGMMLRVPSDRLPGLTDFITDNPDFIQPGGAPIDVNIDPDIMTKLDDLIDIIAPIIPIINTIGNVQFIENHEAPIPPVPDVPIVDATVPQVVNPIINEITNYGDQITESIPQIIETIPQIDEICNNIDTAPYHDLDTGLDHLPSFLVPFITDLRSALGIWHYVTEWLSQIGGTFGFITACLSGTAIMTPIYAGIAGFMCIKVYRRMTG